jgi:hypothetical protein
MKIFQRSYLERSQLIRKFKEEARCWTTGTTHLHAITNFEEQLYSEPQ